MSNKFIFLSFGIWIITLHLLTFFVYLIPIRDVIFTERIWANFDGIHYLKIALNGYTTEARFFPLFPLLISVLTKITRLTPFTSGLVLANLSFVLSLISLNKLLLIDYKEKVVKQTLFFLIIFPSSFFFGVIYSESLFLLLLILSLYFARRNSWFGAITSGMFLILTRFVGVFIIPALIYEYLIQNKSFKFKNYLQLTAIFLITPLGLVAYSIFNYQKWGSYLYFLTAHSELNNGRSSTSLIFPLQTIYRYFKILTSIHLGQYEWWIALLEILVFFFGLTTLILAWKKKVRMSYLIFGSLAFLLPVLSGTFSGLPRYVLILFPIFIAISLIKNFYFKLIYSVFSLTLLFVLLMFFSRGYYIS